MSIECPNCKEAREQSADAAEGWLHPSADYPELLHCNCCGHYYRVLNGLEWIPERELPRRVAEKAHADWCSFQFLVVPRRACNCVVR